ncbi:hypothetical protein [Deinococcus sonorensis]|uniref:Uncharacterized protein n=2 Tax=Deinococcus sonorensis TaxID=309891 RepID=A0AAU7UH23_9DEIO
MLGRRQRRRLVTVCCLLGMVSAQSVTISQPSSLETYVGDKETLSIINEGVTNAKGTLTLVLEGATNRITTAKDLAVPQDDAVLQVFSLPTANQLKTAFKDSPQSNAKSFRGHLVLTTAGKRANAQGTLVDSKSVSVIPVQLYARENFVPYASGYLVFWLPFLLTLASLLLGRVRLGKGWSWEDNIKAAQLLPDSSWLTNFTFLGTLATGVTSVLVLDAANKVAVGLTAAIIVAIIAIAPLLYSFGVQEGQAHEVGKVTGGTGTFDPQTWTMTWDVTYDQKSVTTKESTVRWYFFAVGITAYGASLALTLAFLVVPRVLDVYRAYGLISTDALDYALRTLLFLFGLGSMIFTAQVIKQSIGTKRARLV